MLRHLLGTAAALSLLATLAACSGSDKSSGTSSSTSTSSASTSSAGGSGGGSTSTSTSTSAGTGGAGTAAGTIVPLYTDPGDGSWAAIVTAAKAHPTVAVRAIINPDSGPGTAKDPGYATGIPKLAAAGITVLGYVATTYGAKPKASTHAEIDSYTSWYPGLGGIFFDEMSSTAGDEAYYTELTQYAKSQGYTVTVGNPGTDTSASFVGTVDTMLIYESGGLPSVSSLGGWHTGYDKRNFGIIPYGVPSLDASFVASARADVGFIYLTSDQLPNPWDSLSPYFDGLLAALE